MINRTVGAVSRECGWLCMRGSLYLCADGCHWGVRLAGQWRQFNLLEVVMKAMTRAQMAQVKGGDCNSLAELAALATALGQVEVAAGAIVAMIVEGCKIASEPT
jgi:hypothetical protein